MVTVNTALQVRFRVFKLGHFNRLAVLDLVGILCDSKITDR